MKGKGKGERTKKKLSKAVAVVNSDLEVDFPLHPPNQPHDIPTEQPQEPNPPADILAEEPQEQNHPLDILVEGPGEAARQKLVSKCQINSVKRNIHITL